MDTSVPDPEFAESVLKGLSATPKYLSSRYFYDARGDAIFQKIMASPEYYLTDCEMEILREQGSEIAKRIARNDQFELIELGSGDGSKIRHLLDALQASGAEFIFRPVDISENALELLRERLEPRRPWLDIRPLNVNYMEWLADLRPGSPRKVFAFLGSNLGNFRQDKAIRFLATIRAAMSPVDALLIGLDLKKDPAVIEAAYDDAAGHTRDFNINLLARINRELGGEFDLEGFSHHPVYEAESGAANSYLRSERDQQVSVASLGLEFDFRKGELIFTEVSQKYDQPMIDWIAERAGFRVEHAFYDARGWFTDQLWTPSAAG